MIEKRLLQSAIAVAGVIPVAAGLDGIVRGAAMAGGASVSLDSHVHYLSGLLLGLGLLFWSCIPGVERKGALIRAMTFMVVLGGLARAYAVTRTGWPDLGMRLALVMELGITPLLCLWQARVAARAQGGAEAPPLLFGQAAVTGKPLARR